MVFDKQIKDILYTKSKVLKDSMIRKMLNSTMKKIKVTNREEEIKDLIILLRFKIISYIYKIEIKSIEDLKVIVEEKGKYKIAVLFYVVDTILTTVVAYSLKFIIKKFKPFIVSQTGKLINSANNILYQSKIIEYPIVFNEKILVDAAEIYVIFTADNYKEINNPLEFYFSNPVAKGLIVTNSISFYKYLGIYKIYESISIGYLVYKVNRNIEAIKKLQNNSDELDAARAMAKVLIFKIIFKFIRLIYNTKTDFFVEKKFVLLRILFRHIVTTVILYLLSDFFYKVRELVYENNS